MTWSDGVCLTLSTVCCRWLRAVRKRLRLFHHSLRSCTFGHRLLPGSASAGEHMGSGGGPGFQSRGVLILKHGKLGFWSCL